LYICRKIIDAHGGRIWAARRDGGGATVAFTLPLVDAESTSASASGASEPDATVATSGPAAH